MIYQIFEIFMEIMGSSVLYLFGLGFFAIVFFGIYDLVAK